MEPLFFTEYTPKNNIWGFQNNEYDSSYFEIKNNKISFKFCGFINLEEFIICVFPKGYLLNHSNHLTLKNDAKMLLHVFDTYNHKSIISSSLNSHHTNKNNASFLSLAKEIISDYNKNGLIKTKETKVSLNGIGKTNWSKTFKKTNPTIYNNNLLFLDLINEKKIHSLANELIQIHWLILKDIEQKIGWLYDFKLKNEVLSSFRINEKKALHIIKIAISKSYNQNNIRRLKLLLAYLNKQFYSDSKLSNFKISHTFYFQNIWEDIIKVLFEDNIYIHKKIPKYTWKNGDDKIIKTTSIIPDTLTYGENDTLLIIDAKYYPELTNSSESSKLPGSSDVSKQLIYRKSLLLSDDFSNFKITNIFLLPGTVSEESNALIEIARVGFENPNLHDDLGEILTFKLDVKTSMNHYLKSNTVFKRILLDILKNK